MPKDFHDIRTGYQYGVVVELGSQPFLGRFDAVARHVGEEDFQVIAVGANGIDLDGLAGGCGSATTSLAVRSKGTSKMSAYSTLNRPPSLRSYDCGSVVLSK